MVWAGHQKDQIMIRSLELSALLSSFVDGQGLETELIINQAYMMRPP